MTRKSTVNFTTKFMLTLCGIWPGASCVLFYRVFWIVTMAFVQFCHCLYFVTHVYSVELFDIMDCLSIFLANCKVITKCILFWLNQRKFVYILTMMTEDWNDCINNDISMRKTADKAKTSDRIVNMIIILHTISVVAYCMGNMLAGPNFANQTTELSFLSKIDVPFNIITQRTYRLTLLMQLLHMILCGWAAGITNAMLLTLTLHIAGQIDILCYWLTQYVHHEKNNESIVSTTRQIIQKHQKIINFSENIGSLYTYIALLQFVSNTIMICSLAFLIVTAIGTPNAAEQIGKTLVFYTITNLEAFIFCYAGEYLNNKSEEVSVAAYNSEWYDLKSKDSRVLLFIILRSQKQLTLTAGKMIDLSLKSFTSIMNASGSYLSVLLAMQ